MSIRVENVSQRPAFGISKPKVNQVKNIVSDKKPGAKDSLENAASFIGWTMLIGMMIGSVIYGIINYNKSKNAEPAKTEQAEQPEKIVIDELTPVFNETV